MFTVAASARTVLYPRTAKHSQDAKTFYKNPIMPGSIVAKGFGAYMGNEMLLVSDGKKAYQLACSHSLSPSTLHFFCLSLCHCTVASGGTVGGISPFHIHHFYSVSLYLRQNKLFHLWYTVWLEILKQTLAVKVEETLGYLWKEPALCWITACLHQIISLPQNRCIWGFILWQVVVSVIP